MGKGGQRCKLAVIKYINHGNVMYSTVSAINSTVYLEVAKRVRGSLLHCWWEFKLVQPLGKTV